MAELRTIHLGEPAPERDGPSVMEHLAEAYAAALCYPMGPRSGQLSQHAVEDILLGVCLLLAEPVDGKPRSLHAFLR